MEYGKVLVFFGAFLNYFLFAFGQDAAAKTLENLQITHKCTTDSAEIKLTFPTPGFRGIMYVENQFDKASCKQTITGETTTLNVNFKECLPDSHGNNNFVLMVQPHVNFVTKESFKQPIDCSSSADVQFITVRKQLSPLVAIPSREVLKSNDAVAAELPAALALLDDAGKEVTSATIGDKIKMEIKVTGDGSKKFQEGLVTLCELQDAKNPDNKRQICDECLEEEEVIDEWRWDPENQKFVTSLTVVTLPDAKDITISCTAKLCLEECPEIECSSDKGRRRRRRAYQRLHLLTNYPRVQFY